MADDGGQDDRPFGAWDDLLASVPRHPTPAPENVRSLLPFLAIITALVLVAGIVTAATHHDAAGSPWAALAHPSAACRTASPEVTGTRRLPLHVVTSPFRSALVDVCIDGKGPFPFKLDTGAAQTVLDTSLVAALGLARTGPAFAATGVQCQASSQPIRIDNWSAGGLTLDPQPAVTVRLDGAGGGSGRFAGLFGEDVLSRFGAVRIDLGSQALTVASGEGAPLTGSGVIQGPTAAVTPPSLVTGVRQISTVVVIPHQDSTAQVLAPVTIGGRRAAFYVDTGSSVSVVAPAVVAAAHLQTLGPKVRIRALSCNVEVGTVRTGPWSLGGAALTPRPVIEASIGQRGQGILGLDAIAGAGQWLVIDYRGGRLIIGT